MYKNYVDQQDPKCQELGKKIKAGERFVFHENKFYCSQSKCFDDQFDNAQNHIW